MPLCTCRESTSRGFPDALAVFVCAPLCTAVASVLPTCHRCALGSLCNRAPRRYIRKHNHRPLHRRTRKRLLGRHSGIRRESRIQCMCLHQSERHLCGRTARDHNAFRAGPTRRRSNPSVAGSTARDIFSTTHSELGLR